MQFTSYKFVLSTALLLGIQFSAFAEDTLWLKVVENYQKQQKYVPDESEQVIQAAKADEAKKTVKIKKKFSAWEKGQPTYEIVSMEPFDESKKNNKAADITVLFQTMDKEIFKKDKVPTAGSSKLVNGKKCASYVVEANGAKIFIWVTEDTGEFVEKDVDLSIPLVAEGKSKTEYGSFHDTQLPYKQNFDITIKIPFKSGKALIQEQVNTWRAKETS